MQHLLAYHLKSSDRNEYGYLAVKDIEKAMNETMKKVVRKNGKSQHINKQNLDALTLPLERDSYDHRNYKQMLILMFDKTTGTRLFQQNAAQLKLLSQSGAAGTSGIQRTVRGAVNTHMGSIGEDIIKQGVDIEQMFKHRLGPNTADSRLNEEIILQCLKRPDECNLTLSQDQRYALDTWMQHNRDSQGMVDIGRLLTAIGLPPQTLNVSSRTNVPRRILTDKQLNNCQYYLNRVYHCLHREGQTPEKLVESYKGNQPNLRSVDIKTFKNILRNHIDPMLRPELEDINFLQDLAAYLSREEVGMVSFKKLLQAMNLSDNDPPLAQDGVDELREYQESLKMQIKSSTVPFQVIDLHHYMKREKLTMKELFKVQGTQHEMAVRDF